MILFVDVILKQIHKQKKAYPWNRPESCPDCDHDRVWSHGYVSRLFDGFRLGLFIKCFRCPKCGCVITLRPKTHFTRVQATIEKIRFSISHRLKTGRWPPGGSPSRKRHWLKNLRHKIKAHLTNAWAKAEPEGFDQLQLQAIVPVSKQIN